MLMVLLLRPRRSLLCHEVALVLRWSRNAKNAQCDDINIVSTKIHNDSG